MLTPQHFIALDLELNQPSNRIIQVGVAIGNRFQPEADYVTKSWLLDPLESISEFIVGLTGITDEAIVKHSVSWGQMAQELSALVVQYDVFVNPITWGGGDSVELLQELRSREIEFKHFGRRWVDIKTYHVLDSLAKGKSAAGGLRSVMGKYKLAFEGEPHRADVDAYNTLRLFFQFLGRQAALDSLVLISKAV